MTSKLVVNTIESDTGISSVSFASSISMSSTSKFHFSAAGIDIGADTNINRPAAGVLGFNINGSQKVVIRSTGKLGIGTDNPQQMIEVQDRSGGTLIGLSVGTQYGNASFGGYNNYPAIMNSSSQPLIYCDTNNDRTVFFGDTVGFGTTCAFRVNGAERLRINSTGQLLLMSNTGYNPSSSLLSLATDASAAANMLSDSSSIYNHNNPAFVHVQNMNNTGDGQEAGIILHSKSSFGGAWAIYGKRTTSSFKSDLIFRGRSGSSSSAERLRIDLNGQVLPGADDAQNLGSSTKRWANIYAADMHFSNKGKTNDVDGTWGDWTLQEGEDSVYMINNRTGKKYAITMKEVN